MIKNPRLNRCPLCGEKPQLQWCDKYRIISKCGLEFSPHLMDMTGHQTVATWNAATANIIRTQRLDEE